jgi:hypothetical protein
MLAAIVQIGNLLEVVLVALAATIGVATLFSLAVLGVTRAFEQREAGNVTLLAYGALAAVCLGGCFAAAVYGVVLLASK